MPNVFYNLCFAGNLVRLCYWELKKLFFLQLMPLLTHHNGHNRQHQRRYSRTRVKWRLSHTLRNNWCTQFQDKVKQLGQVNESISKGVSILMTFLLNSLYKKLQDCEKTIVGTSHCVKESASLWNVKPENNYYFIWMDINANSFVHTIKFSSEFYKWFCICFHICLMCFVWFFSLLQLLCAWQSKSK